MEEKQINLMTTMDAKTWAEDFMKHWGAYVDTSTVDQALMHSWFAAAIMCGYDHVNYHKEEE